MIWVFESLGFFQHLTELDVSENQIQVLDLSALNRLELLQCSKNSVEQLVVNGHSLKSLIAGNNCECFSFTNIETVAMCLLT